MSEVLSYLRLLEPLFLLFPLLSLVPKPPAPPPELPGIRPVTVRIITPRRGLILTLLCLLAFTLCLDAVALVVRMLIAKDTLSGLGLFANVVFVLGGFVLWSLAAIVVEWRARWGDRAVVMLATLGLVFEVPSLVYIVLNETQSHGKYKLFSILSIPPSALRLLLFPILLVALASPIIRFEPADERTSLLASSDTEGESSEPRGRQAYGTFPNGENNENTVKPDGSRSSSQPPATGTTTPAPNKQPIKIPKALGEVKKEEKPLEWRQTLARLKKLSPHLWPSTSPKLQFFCVLCMISLAVTRVLQPLQPLALGGIVRSLTQAQQGIPTSPWFPFAAYFVIRLLISSSGVLSFVQNRLWVPVSQYTDREMMLMCFNHLLNLSLAYHTKRNTGEVLKVIDRGSALNSLFQVMLFTAIPTLFDIVIAFGVFFYLYGGLLAVLTFSVMLAYVAVSVTMTQWRVATRRILVEKDVKQRGIVSDVLTNWESVKYFTAEQREQARFKDAILSYQDTEAKWQISYQLLFLIQTFLLSLGLMAGSLIIAFRALRGEADAAQFVVFTQYFMQLSGPLDRLGWLYRQLSQNATDAEKMFTLLAQPTEVVDHPDAKDLVVTDGIIEFENVRFSYGGEVEALKGVSFRIGKGQSMALVGESGSGKSTILRLLYRFYDITSGRILIDGQDISRVTQLSLRRAIGIVPQDSVLWNDTIGANISYGKEGASDEEIITAAKAARLHERIMSFPEEYATIVGERGVRLSGGEKQRVSLARMFLKSPAILVLDEATSALDTETEREIQKALADLAKNRSSLSIAHRLSTIINSDQIVVMKDGAVIENGTYKELLELDGAFASMWKKQIFTEAEIVAQAQGIAPQDALIELEDATEAANDASQDKEDDVPKPSLSEPDIVGEGGTGFSVEVSDYQRAAAGFPVDETAKSAEGTAGPGQVMESIGEESHSLDQAQDSSTNSNGPEEKADEDSPSAEQTTSTSTAPNDNPPPGGQEATPVSYAEAVKTSTEPTRPDSAEPVDSAAPAQQAEHEAEQAEGASTSTPAKSDAWAADALTPSPTATVTPENRNAPVAFPAHPPVARMPTSQSQRSGLSSRSQSASDVLDDGPESSKDAGGGGRDKDKEKRRNRLSSIKGFVRRISDQGVARSPSLGGGGGGGKSPATPVTPGEANEATPSLARGPSGSTTPTPSANTNANDDGKRKKRLSMQKGK